MTDDNNDGLAALGLADYKVIAARLREQIETGEYPPGARFPGMLQLAQWFRINQRTARQVLDELKNEGLIVAMRGIGTFVREFRPARRLVFGGHSPDRSIWPTNDERRVMVRQLRPIDEEVPDDVAFVLGIAPSSVVRVRQTRYSLQGRTIQLAKSYRPVDLADAAPARFRDELCLRTPSSTERTVMRLRPGDRVAEVTRTAYLTWLMS